MKDNKDRDEVLAAGKLKKGYQEQLKQIGNVKN
jgi:hypothetical protein